MVCTRPDIAHAVGMVSRFLSNLGKHHWDGHLSQRRALDVLTIRR